VSDALAFGVDRVVKRGVDHAVDRAVDVDGAADVDARAARAVLAHHGKSFRFAGALLPRDQLDDAAIVYAFCRAADDAVDEAGSVDEAAAAADEFIAELDGVRPARPVVRAFLRVAARREIDVGFARELLVGMKGDAVARVVVDDDAALLLYCYRAAGTVGGLMCGVLGVRHPRARPHAIDLGIAMQLTNICRDVLEDAQRQRVYVPRTRLPGVVGADAVDEIADGRARSDVMAAVRALLALAERYYESGADGLRFIPWRSRMAIAVASRVYRAIGHKLLRAGGDPLLGRTRTTLVEKLGAAAVALVALLAPRRARHDRSLHALLPALPGLATPRVLRPPHRG
jgi:phytoene synthase